MLQPSTETEIDHFDKTFIIEKRSQNFRVTDEKIAIYMKQ